MLTKRIIACLDIKNGRTVKGVNFVNLRDVGDPVEQGHFYSQQGIDELVYLDITATNENRKTFAGLVNKIARRIDIPFTVGGGISTVEDVNILLGNGADKISINSAAVKNPGLIDQLAAKFGSQCVVLAVDAKQIAGKWLVHLVGGRIPTQIDMFEWIAEAEKRGAGEILFTSMDHDGTNNGFAIEALKQVSRQVRVPVIASGGAGNVQHFADAFVLANADAALAASVFHDSVIPIAFLKTELKKRGINVRSIN
jgi:imidazole glycerol-phosphate synthase subunit HisF